MKRFSTATATASAIALFMSTGAALADVTPAEVWSDWKAYLGDMGFAVTADEDQTSSGLTLSNIVLTQTLPEDGGDITITIPEISATDNGDGTVSIIYPENLPLMIAGTGEEAFDLDLIYRTTDMDMTVSGDPSEMTYDYTAANVGVTLNKLTSDGEVVDFEAANFDMQDVEGRTVMSVDGGRKSDQVIRSGTTTYEIAFTDPDDVDSHFNLAGSIENIDMMSKMVMPENIDINNMAAALAAGFSGVGEYAFGPSSSTFEFTEDGDLTKGTSGSGGGKLSMQMDEEEMRYNVKSRDVRIEAMVPDLPFPVAFDMKEAEFALTMPISEDEDPQDFGLTLTLGDFTVGDDIWSLFDPESKLPRDPATVAIDLSGKATLLANILDPAQMAEAQETMTPPAEVNALTLKKLLISLVGTELSGKGEVVFDNEDNDAYGGMPVPVGNVSLKLQGANALLDKLVEMGLVPQDQVMGARMMMSMVTVAGDGEDELISDIELTEDGGIIANGQRLK